MDKESEVKLTKKQVTVVLLVFIVSLVTAALIAGLLARPTSIVTDKVEEPWMDIRLPRHILPVHYDLTLFPDLYQPDQDYAPFYGNVSILINITLKPTRHLIVHANELIIRETTVRLHQTSKTTLDESLHVQRAFNFSSNQYWVVELDRDLQPQSVVWLDIRFDGSMLDKRSYQKWTGLYRSEYLDSRTQQTRFHCNLTHTGWPKNWHIFCMP